MDAVETSASPSPPPEEEGPSAGLGPGTRLGEWVLEERIGRGGYAEVWRARHNALNERRVAIKVPHDPAFAAALRREGVLQDGVSGEHVLEVLGLDPDHEPPYLVVPLVEGRSLRALLDAEGALSPAEAVRILRQVCLGLRAAHARGVVHRDLKPENILLDREGRVFVSDFGLGLAAAAATEELLASGSLRTQSGKEIAGTLLYMAPEQRDPTAQVDARADLYALGVVLFELLTGEAPCGGELPSEVRPGLDPRFDALFKRLCVRLPARAASVDEVLAALEDLSAEPPRSVASAADQAALRAVGAGLLWRLVAFGVDALPFWLLAFGPLRLGRGLLPLGLYLLYDIACTAAFGRTLGRKLVGLRLVDRSGRPATGAQRFLRECLRVLSLGFCGLGYLPVLLGQPSFHDVFADTRVVHDR